MKDLNEAADLIIQSDDLTAQNSAIEKIIHKVITKRTEEIKAVEADLFNKKNSLNILLGTFKDVEPINNN